MISCFQVRTGQISTVEHLGVVVVQEADDRDGREATVGARRVGIVIALLSVGNPEAEGLLDSQEEENLPHGELQADGRRAAQVRLLQRS